MRYVFLIWISLIFSTAYCSDCNENKTISSEIRNYLTTIDSSKNIKLYQVDKLVELFQLNEKQDFSNEDFPEVEGDSRLFYSFIDKIFMLALKDGDFILPIFKLNFIVKRNVEWAEYLSELPHKIAVENTYNFLVQYKKLDKDQKETILSDLFWLREYDLISLFLMKLDKIDDKSLIAEINEIKNRLK